MNVRYLLYGGALAACALMVYGGSTEHRRFIGAAEIVANVEPSTVTHRSQGAVHIPIVIYHNIRTNAPSDTLYSNDYSISPDEFEQQLRYLHDNGYTAITLDQLAAMIHSGTTTPIAQPVVLTFDDGWQSQYHVAFPLLEKYHDTATFYIFTDPIGHDSQYMTWSEVQTMDTAGMTIGSHTLSHPNPLTLNEQELTTEIAGSKKLLELHVGKPVLHFAVPYGHTTDTIQRLVQQAGYMTGRTVYRSTYHSQGDILRLGAYFAPTSVQDFAWILRDAP